MVIFPSFLDGFTRSVPIKKEMNNKNDVGRETAEKLAKEAKKNELILSSSGTVKANKSKQPGVSVLKERDERNQDYLIVWEGHLVAKRVRKSVPASLLCNWQETLASTSLDLDFEIEVDRNLHLSDIWKQSYLKTYAAVDQELKHHPGIDSFFSGTTALTLVKQVLS
ncbi:hypothetical protein SO802_032381 [Lithocarpus litseifolius]|uniref:Uncharacterized protein n=1 Tax=Lithocarpus litseifolius TaxID=425828 RepID=A0AAW2BRE6_9ROSI